jgi:hypothetical protein
MDKPLPDQIAPPLPSWLRWPPNCCETCTGWQQFTHYEGRCEQPNSINSPNITDSRFRCPDFIRKPDAQ